MYWFEFVITSIALVMLYWLWLRQFKHALLTLYGIVNAVATLQMSMYIAWKRRWVEDMLLDRVSSRKLSLDSCTTGYPYRDLSTVYSGVTVLEPSSIPTVSVSSSSSAAAAALSVVGH